jgi:hypothetical protein
MISCTSAGFEQSSEWLATPIYSTMRIYEMGESAMAIHVCWHGSGYFHEAFTGSAPKDNEIVRSELLKKPRQTLSK